MNNLQVVILAAGRGTRMWPIDTSKPLLSFAGQPLIKFIFQDLQASGIQKFSIVANKDNLNALKASLPGDNISFYVQKDLTQGMAGGLASISNFGSQPTIVVNSDDLFDLIAYQHFISLVNNSLCDIAVSGIEKEEYFPGGYLVFENNKVIGIREKPGKANQPSNFINLVLHYFKNPQIILSAMQQVKSEKDDIYELALSKLLASGLDSEFFSYTGNWQSLKYPWQILPIMDLVLQNRLENFVSPKAVIDKNAVIKGKVVIKEGVKILPGACIIGPCFLGKNTVIGNNSLVRESMIGDNCVVGFDTEIARSWINNNCWFHKNYIGDSVIDKNVSFGSGGVLANLRLDEQNIVLTTKDAEKINSDRKKLGAIIGRNCRIGINTSLMPGVMVGSGCSIGPGLVLSQNLAENSLCFLKNKLVLGKGKKLVLPERNYDY